MTKDDFKNKSLDFWREKLDPHSFQVCWLRGTEPPFQNAYHDFHEEGTFLCKCCETPLFSSDAKFDSGTGWPSFFQPINSDALEMLEDLSHGMVRVEIKCGTCGSHLGHVFPDGPAPTFQRFCMNSASLDFRRK